MIPNTWRGLSDYRRGWGYDLQRIAKEIAGFTPPTIPQKFSQKIPFIANIYWLSA